MIKKFLISYFFHKSIKFAIVFVALVGFASAHLPDRSGEHGGGHSGGNGGGNSGEHGSKSCIIAPTGTTNCSGVTGANCSDSANLKVNEIKKKYFNIS